MLHLCMLPADDADEVQLIERDSSGDRQPVQEVES
jgi:hypothetical protein